MILKSRQTGVSNAVALEATHKAQFNDDKTILFVSQNQGKAANLVTYCKQAIAGQDAPPDLKKNNDYSLEFRNGSRIISLAATETAGRSYAASDVYLDEFAFCRYADAIYTAIIGTTSTGGNVTVLSTPNGRSNMFYRLWAGLEGGAWSRHRVHWMDCPRYFDQATQQMTPEFVELREGYTKQQFAQEFDCDFLTSGLAVFKEADIDACVEGYNPDQAFDYVITAWDIGRRQDYTVGITLGHTKDDHWHIIEFERFVGVPFPVIQSMIDKRSIKYQGTYTQSWVESNGIGDPVIENLAHTVNPFVTSHKSKINAISATQLLIEQHRLHFSRELHLDLERELNLYQWDDKELVQDCVMALAIGAQAIIALPQIGIANFSINTDRGEDGLRAPSRWMLG